LHSILLSRCKYENSGITKNIKGYGAKFSLNLILLFKSEIEIILFPESVKRGIIEGYFRAGILFIKGLLKKE